MALTRKQNLLKYAEEAAYSSKGHFKSADWTRISVQVCIALPIILSIILIVYQGMSQEWSRFLNCIAMVFSFLALMSPLVSNQEQSFKRTSGHMTLGNDYLDLYCEIRNMVSEDATTKENIDSIAKKKKELDSKTNDLRIGLIPRFWSMLVIKKEMDLDWVYNK